MDAVSESYRDYTAAAGRIWGGAPRRRIEEAALYLTHVDGAHSLRAVSVASGKSLSTVHRAVRRMEALRDDPLIDRTLESIGRQRPLDGDTTRAVRLPATPSLDDDDVRRCLTRLAEEGAFLMVAHGAGRAGVFSKENGLREPLLVIDAARAAEMVARGWLRLVSRTEKSAKYVAEARVLKKVMACDRLATRGRDLSVARQSVPALARLARPSGTDGVPGLTPAAMAAARRLRNDYEAGLADAVPDKHGRDDAASESARRRVAAALDAVGTGLSEPIHRICCLDERLSVFERRMGWAPRTARVVLGIALARLAAHYGIDVQSA